MSSQVFDTGFALSIAKLDTEVRNAWAKFNAVADNASSMTVERARQQHENPSPADVQQSSDVVGRLVTDMANDRDATIKVAEQQHKDRVAALATALGHDTGPAGSPDSPAAQLWLQGVLPAANPAPASTADVAPPGIH
jgi:hypothetical protein